MEEVATVTLGLKTLYALKLLATVYSFLKKKKVVEAIIFSKKGLVLRGDHSARGVNGPCETLMHLTVSPKIFKKH